MKPPALAARLMQNGILGWANKPDTGHSILVERANGCPARNAQNQVIKGTREPLHPTAPINKQDFFSHLVTPGIELDVPWLYQDSKNNVTVGIGHLTRTVNDALALKQHFEHQHNPGQPVTDQDIRDAFAIVTSPQHTGGFDYTHYEPLTTLRLTGVASFQLVNDDFARIFGELMARSEYSSTDFDTYPTEAKFAIMDMAFTLGARGTAVTFWKFTKAVRHRNWRLVANESSRSEPSAKRNQIVRDLFLTAAKRDAKNGVSFLDPDCRKTRTTSDRSGCVSSDGKKVRFL